MPRLEGIWADESGKTLQETTNIVFCYVSEGSLERHIEEIREFLIEMGRKTNQAEVGLAYKGEFAPISI